MPFSKLVRALGIEKLVGPVVIRRRDENPGQPVQITVVRRSGVHERLGGGDAVLLQHHDQELGVNDRAGVKQFQCETSLYLAGTAAA